LDKYFYRATLEYEEKASEEPHRIENCDKVGSQTGDVMPDSQRGSLCTRSEVSHFEGLSLKKGVRRLLHLMSLTSTKIHNLPEPLDGQTILPLGQMS